MYRSGSSLPIAIVQHRWPDVSVSLAAQTVPPAWVAIADLGSNASNAAALSQLARRHGVSYVRIEHHGPWNQALAFNTALRHMPTSTHAVQLDADMILHPDLLRLAQHALSRCDALAAVPELCRRRGDSA